MQAAARRPPLVLLLGALLQLLRARLALAMLSWARVSRPPKRRVRSAARYAPEEAARAVDAVARRLPGTRCLARALALRALLRRGGRSADLRLGVARTPAGELAAHAWVECEGAVFDCGEDPAGYSAFPAA